MIYWCFIFQKHVPEKDREGPAKNFIRGLVRAIAEYSLKYGEYCFKVFWSIKTPFIKPADPIFNVELSVQRMGKVICFHVYGFSIFNMGQAKGRFQTFSYMSNQNCNFLFVIESVNPWFIKKCFCNLASTQEFEPRLP